MTQAAKLLSAIALFLVVVLLCLSFPRRVSLTTADLGRHIKNGEEFFQTHRPQTTNYYSYTEPEYHAVNHHWLSGVVFYLIWKYCGGFDGVSIFYFGVCLATFWIYFRLARRIGGFDCALAAAVLCLPLMTMRLEIRPEGFSVLFIGIYLSLLWEWKEGRISRRWLWAIPAFQLIWVNLHIYFVFGLFVIGVYFIDALLVRRDRGAAMILLRLGLLSLAMCLVNPFGWEGLMTPFTIFREYGYPVGENQSVWFEHSQNPSNPLYIHLETVWLLALVAVLGAVLRRGWRGHFLALAFLGVFGILSFQAIRNIGQFGFVFLPFFSGSLRCLVENRTVLERCVKIGAACVAIGIAVGVMMSRNFYYTPFYRSGIARMMKDENEANRWWLVVLKNPKLLFGLEPRVNASAEFFQEMEIQGPIFNNYDIGGYLIFHFFPKWRVFVDNRPEAYSVSFFEYVYIPMQENEFIWKKVDERYQFNCIFFAWRDRTPWAQPFLLRRVRDPQWAPVYFDRDVLILVKRNEKNAELIRRHEISQGAFQEI